MNRNILRESPSPFQHNQLTFNSICLSFQDKSQDEGIIWRLWDQMVPEDEHR